MYIFIGIENVDCYLWDKKVERVNYLCCTDVCLIDNELKN